MIRSRCVLFAACTIVAEAFPAVPALCQALPPAWLAAPALGNTPPAAPKKGARPKPAPAAVAPAHPPTPPPAEAAPPEPRPVVMDLALGGGSLTRRLQFNDDLFGAFHNSTVHLAAQASGSLLIYPLAPITRGFFSQLGLYGDVSHSIGTTISDGSGAALPALVVAYDLGLRIRIPIGSVELDPTGGYGRQQFDVGTLPGSPAYGPNFDLGFLFADLHGRWQATGALAVLFDAAYLGVIQNGLAESGYFPRSKVAGIDLGTGLGVTLIEAIELRLTVSYQRFFYSMHSEPGDAHVAGGATDEYLWGTLVVAVLIH